MKNNCAHIIFQFASKIRKLREAKQISQERLAERMGVHRTYVGMIERGEKNITLKNIEKIAKALNVDIKDLF